MATSGPAIMGQVIAQALQKKGHKIHKHGWRRVVFPLEKPIKRHILWFPKGFSHGKKNPRNTLCVSFRFPIDKFFVFLKIYLFETW